jgi:hypothetical protein
MHKRALGVAAGYFTVNFIIGVFCLLQAYGSGLSDVYHPEPTWFEILVAVLGVLQLPVAVYEAVELRHSQHGANLVFLCAFGFLWSLVVGYGAVWLAGKVGKPK